MGAFVCRAPGRSVFRPNRGAWTSILATATAMPEATSNAAFAARRWDGCITLLFEHHGKSFGNIGLIIDDKDGDFAARLPWIYSMSA